MYRYGSETIYNLSRERHKNPNEMYNVNLHKTFIYQFYWHLFSDVLQINLLHTGYLYPSMTCMEQLTERKRTELCIHNEAKYSLNIYSVILLYHECSVKTVILSNNHSVVIWKLIERNL